MTVWERLAAAWAWLLVRLGRRSPTPPPAAPPLGARRRRGSRSVKARERRRRLDRQYLGTARDPRITHHGRVTVCDRSIPV